MTHNAVLRPEPLSAPSSGKQKRVTLRPAGLWQTVGPVAVFIALFALVAVLTPTFVTGGGLGILTVQAAPILLVALGQAMVLNVGSIDLSNAATVVLSAMILAQALEPLGPAAPLLTLVVVTLIGAVNGFLIAFGQIPSFALTLGTLGIVQAASLEVSHATTVYATANTDLLAPLFGTALVGLPLAFWVGVVCAVVLWAVLRFTRSGQGMTAVGLNESGALFSGLRTRWLKVAAFALSGLLSGLAGVLVIAQAGAASSFGLGSDLLLPGITAAIVGGTAITGGVTNPINIVFGALTVGLVPIGATSVGISPQAQSLVYGLVIIVAVALTMGRKRQGVVK
ncbi:Inner-membrane translocator [Sinomonas atrocyanea]|uniref:Autoinducer 2 import system permease protein LsrD n=1 Tax=Sinomonas atrocyanea TaxID=37927 RepID=A0A126ZWD4_9MICC|nr:ABC transporter permease [Sinomonas atrocyanea]AMM30851.1 Inner-membrane translocator [Sinomonas atrocyanea]GEB64986.1 ribose ABC transporter permease [Sinomonas atrocyanea]GGG68803.1 ribose ABC transporter permease [Sinomonas atrocyanea]